jgi:nicotinamide-nucleotide amidase
MVDTDREQRELDQLVALIGESLVEAKQMLTTAESCTGGWLSMLLTSLAGSSAWFDRGFVTYSNQSKQEMLSVDEQIIEIHGAVSEETARYMAIGAIQHSHAELALSITGIAGPGGGSDEKPVGTVCFGWVLNGQCDTATCHFSGDREQVRAQAVRFGLEKIVNQLDLLTAKKSS